MSEIKNVFHDKIIEMGKQTDDYGQFELYCQKIQKKGIELCRQMNIRKSIIRHFMTA